jgi:iron(III) transport system substrate-binding protein
VPKTHADFTKLLTTKADKYQKKVTTYDAEKVGVGFHAGEPGRQAEPGVLGSGQGDGARGTNMQSSTGTMMERISPARI